MDRLRDGIRKFRNETFPQQRELMETLAREGQKPHTLVIACSDSRIQFSDWTQADPGEFFIIRNAGNIVPHPSVPTGVSASIDYALEFLPIRNVIVAGHSHCGAVTALFDEVDESDGISSVEAWLLHAGEARERTRAKHPDCDRNETIRHAIGENVLLQIENLRQYESVKARSDDQALEIIGWVLEFETGTVWEYDAATDQWAAIE